jgi:DNA-binding LytR/AlgR family response regulator
MSLRCLIIDDEPLAHDVILTHLEDIPFLQVIGHCYRATDAYDFLSKNEVDVLLLDIRMPKLNGIDFIKTLKQKPIIIITSAFEEYALESFDLDICDYLLKPFRFDRMLKAANRALEMHQVKNQIKHLHSDTNQIAIKADKRHIIIKLEEIYYLESLGNYVKVWKESDFLLTLRTLMSFEDQLPPTLFIRAHKSYIVHKKFVHYLEGNMIILKNGTQVPIGKNYKQIVNSFLTNQ